MESFHATTIVSVRRDGKVVIGGDGQVTLGNTVMKANARKIRRLGKGDVLAGFAGATADAFTLFELFEQKLDKHGANLTRAAVELAKDWRTDRRLGRLEAMLAVADKDASLLISATATCSNRSRASSRSARAVRTRSPRPRRCSRTARSIRARSSRRRSASPATSASTRTTTSRSKSFEGSGEVHSCFLPSHPAFRPHHSP